MTEAEIQKACIELLCWAGWLVIRCNSGRTKNLPWVSWYDRSGKRHPKGVSDLLAIKGRILAIECKAPGEELRPDQRDFLREAMEHGAMPLVIEDVKDLESYL